MANKVQILGRTVGLVPRLLASLLLLFTASTPLLGELDAPWIDLPQGDLTAIGEWDAQILSDLNPLFSAYHAVAKTDPDRGQERIQWLEYIAATLERAAATVDDSHGRYFLSQLCTIALHKADYLRALMAVGPVCLDVEQVSGWKTLPICNRRRFDPSIGQFFGTYELELQDPCHRSLENFYDLWLGNGGDGSRPLDFFFWLEGMNLPNWIPHWRILTAQELANCLVHTDGEGLLRFDDGQLLDGGEGGDDERIFIIDRDGRLLVAKASPTVHHVSLSGGRSVLASGNLCAVAGKIRQISLESGHYLPTRDNGRQLVLLLRRLGVHLIGAEEFCCYDHIGLAVHRTLADEFPDLFPSAIGQNKTFDQFGPAINEHKKHQFEGKGNGHGRHHHHAQGHEHIGHDNVHRDEGQKEEYANLERCGQFAHGKGWNKDQEVRATQLRHVRRRPQSGRSF
jgi:hypothetical protein